MRERAYAEILLIDGNAIEQLLLLTDNDDIHSVVPANRTEEA